MNDTQESSLREVLLVIDKCCFALGIDFYILGALARDIWFTEQGIVASRTKDIDFAVLLSETDQFYQLKGQLIDQYEYAAVRGNEFALRAPNGLQIDILPFGMLEVEDGVAVKGDGLNKIKVNGFKEVYLESVREAYVLEDKNLKLQRFLVFFY